jgi:archaellum component FlaF (FlaF/FlaG flagellin family)
MNITRISLDSAGNQDNQNPGFSSASISADGRFVAFESSASNLVPEDTNDDVDIFVRDTLTNTTTRVSVDSEGNQVNSSSWRSSISGDGRFVAFSSSSSSLVPGDTNDSYDIFVRDTLTNTTTRVSVDSEGNQANNQTYYGSIHPSISADGRFVAFESDDSNLVPGDTNSHYDIFVRDTLANTTTRVSVDSEGNQGEGPSINSSISASGRFVAFESSDGIFVRDTFTNTTTRVSVDSEGNQGDGASFTPSISASGRFVAFDSFATNLVPGDTNNKRDIFVRDTLTNTTTRVSVDSEGNQQNGSSSGSLVSSPSISSDGRFVAFDSDASNLVSGDTTSHHNIFVRDTLTNTTIRVSVGLEGNQANESSFGGSISADGRIVVFDSLASNLVPGDTNDFWDVFIAEIGSIPGINTPNNNINGTLGNNILSAATGNDIIHSVEGNVANSGEVLASFIALLLISLVLKISFRSRV